MNAATALLLLFAIGVSTTAVATLSGIMVGTVVGLVIVWHAVFGGLVLYFD